MEPTSSCFPAPQGNVQMLQQPGSMPVQTNMTTQQRASSHFAPVEYLAQDCTFYNTGTPTCVQGLRGGYQVQFDGLAQQQEAMSYLGAPAGLVADASVLVAAAAAATLGSNQTNTGSHSQHTPGVVTLQDCMMPAQTMSSCSSNGAFTQAQALLYSSESPYVSGGSGGSSGSFIGASAVGCSTACMAAAPGMPQQAHWANLHRQHYGANSNGSTNSLPGLARSSCSTPCGTGMAGTVFLSAGSNLGATANVNMACEPQAYALQGAGLMGVATAGSGAGMATGWCDALGNQVALAGSAHSGWW